jgi:hypothetical protein
MAELPGPWPARIAWAALPITVGPVLGDALADRSLSVARTGSVLGWGLWAVGLLAVAVPRAASLTALRILAPLVLPVALWAAVTVDGGAGALVAVAWAALLLLAVAWPEVAEAFADGSSYGDERRMLLRTPTPLLLGPVPIAWAAAVAAPVAGPLLLAARQWAIGGVVLVVGGAASVAAVRALHGLARRWVVFVPAGLVLHDLQAMGDPVLFPRSAVAALGPAAAAGPQDDGDVCDLTLGTVGLVLQLDLREPLEVAPRRGRQALELVSSRHLRFAPARPGALVTEARRRRIG